MVSRDDRIWVIYPEYFDAGRSCAEGRRVNRNLAMKKIMLDEVADAAAALNMGPVKEDNRHHPSDWYSHRGRVLVRKERPKEVTIRSIAEEIKRRRARQQ